MCKFQKEKKQVNDQRYRNKETQQNLKKYNNSSVFVHSHSLSDDDSISIKVLKPVAFVAHFLYSLRFLWLSLPDLHASCQLHGWYWVKSGLHVLRWLKVVNEHNHLLTSYNWIVTIHKSQFRAHGKVCNALFTSFLLLSSVWLLTHFSVSCCTRDVVFHFFAVSIYSVRFLTVLLTLWGFFTSFTTLVLPLKKEVKLDSFFFLVGGLSCKVIATSSFSEDIFSNCEIIIVQLKKTGNN